MPQPANKNPWSHWASQYLPGTYAHPDAPDGGTGPGYSRPGGPSGTSFADVGVADPHSPEGNEITPAQAQAEYAKYELTKAKDAVRDATTWGKLRIVAERVLGPQSFGLGVAYGVVKNPVMSAAQLVKLQKIFIEADIYERLTRRTSSWKQLLMGMAYSNPAVVPIMGYLVRSGKITIEDLKRSYEMREGLIKEVGDVFAHPLDFFAKAKDQLKVNYVEKWELFRKLRAQTDLKSQFEAGEIFGDVLMEVTMLVLTVVSVAGAAAKLAAKVPQLVRVAEFVRGVRAAEVGGVAAEAGEAVEEAKAVTKAAEAMPKEEGGVSKVEPIGHKIPVAEDLYRINANGTKAVQIRQGTNGKVAVMGRDMNTVRPYAEELKAKGYDVEIFDKDVVPKAALEEWKDLKAKYAPDYIPDSEVTKSSLFKANKEWVEKLVNNDYTVTDIGSSLGASASPFYNMEKATIFK